MLHMCERPPRGYFSLYVYRALNLTIKSLNSVSLLRLDMERPSAVCALCCASSQGAARVHEVCECA